MRTIHEGYDCRASRLCQLPTGDEEASATLIERELSPSRQFGSEDVFRASKTIQPGDDFEREILTAVRASRALLAVIGPRWLTAQDGNGGRALDREHDWTRREICEAFAHDVRVIPVLVGDTRLVPGLKIRDTEGLNGSDDTNRVTNHFHQAVDAPFANFGIKL